SAGTPPTGRPWRAPWCSSCTSGPSVSPARSCTWTAASTRWAPPSAVTVRSSSLPNQRELESDVDPVAHEHAAGLDGLVPRQIPVAPVDRRRARERQPLLAPQVPGRPVVEL